MIVIVTLRYPDTGLTNEQRDDVKTYERVTCLDVNPVTGFLTVQTPKGDYTFAPDIWSSFLVSRDDKQQ